MALFSKETEEKKEQEKNDVDEIFEWLEELDDRLEAVENLLSRVAGRMGVE